MTPRPHIDSCVRVVPRSNEDILRRLPRQYRASGRGAVGPEGMGLGHPFGNRYAPPIDDIHPSVVGGLAGEQVTDPDVVGNILFNQRAAKVAILLAPNRLLRPDWRYDAAVVSATNEWLASTWLSSTHGNRFVTSIHISLGNPREAIKEIERWAGHPQFVQVAAPMHAHAPYGEQRYFEVWEAAAHHRLPVAIHGDGSGGVELPATMAGLPNHFLDYHTLLPLGGFLRFISLVTEGVFERIPNLTLVLTDGGLSIFPELLWRLDAKARSFKDEMPWVTMRPTEYLAKHVRFVTRKDDFPSERHHLDVALRLSRADQTLLYGSNYPMWDLIDLDGEVGDIPESSRDHVLVGNALATYPKLGVLMAKSLPQDPVPTAPAAPSSTE